MDASTDQLTPAQDVAARSDATKPTGELFRYSTWLHVGPSAEGCEDAQTGACGNPLHFHAWMRLPNQFQHKDIRERALAAKARRLRQLRDPQTDAFQILEADMELLEAEGDREALIDELVNKEWWKVHLEAMGDVEEADEFKHIDRDRERLQELAAMPADERPADEYGELERHLQSYGEKVEARVRELQAPHRSALDGQDMAQLVTLVRKQRIEADASAAFMETYSAWQWVAGTYTLPPQADPAKAKRVFASVDELADAAPEVVEELRAAFTELETALQRGARGN